MKLLLTALSCLLLLPACGHLGGLLPEADTGGVVYALGPREGFTSPLAAALKPACPPLEFPADGHALTGAHEKILRDFLAELGGDLEKRHIIVGHTPVELPGGYARSLSERRAQAARQFLIENGMPAASLQTLGLGHDSPAGATGHRVILYAQ